MDWQDLKLFLAVVRHGGLSGAARETGVSPATLGRRMTSLEDAVNVRLFERGARGYVLTQVGMELLVTAQEMEVSASAIGSWKDGLQGQRRLRISAGFWTTRLLADNLSSYWNSKALWLPEFLSDLGKLDIARRQVDIGIRNARPQEPWLAGQKVGKIQFGVYQAKGADKGETANWIMLIGEAANFPTGRWLHRNAGQNFGISTNESAHALSLARQGYGRIVLPDFVGDAYEDLERTDEDLSELETERWLVMHQDDRHRAEMRQAIDALKRFLKTDPRVVG